MVVVAWSAGTDASFLRASIDELASIDRHCWYLVQQLVTVATERRTFSVVVGGSGGGGDRVTHRSDNAVQACR